MATPFYDATVRHAVYIERMKASMVRDIVAKVRGVSSGLFAGITEGDLDSLTRRELTALMRKVDRIISTGYGPIVEDIENTLKEFAIYEAQWQGEALVRSGMSVSLAVPSNADIWAAMYSRPFQGKLLSEWLTGLEAGTAKRVREAIRQGYVDGKSPLEIARDIRGTRNRAGIMDISVRGAQAMARTAVAHTASAARARTYQANRSVRYEQWASVLDHRTSAICRGRDGKIYEKGKGPRPPAHIACRSTMIPVTSRNKAALEVRPTYNDWLTRQPATVQDDILGKTRGKLFREGGYSVDRFIDKSGQEYTLDQLKAKDADAWAEVFEGT